MTTQMEPELAVPGAGLPKLELLIARLIFALRRLTGSRNSFDALIRNERELICDLVQACDSASANRRILIKRLPGLEDSSRYWSVWMTLDHLRIVNLELGRVIGTLTKGVIPEGEASTAFVKPRNDLNADVVTAFEESLNVLIETVAAAPKLDTAVRYSHPWFGPLNAAGWHALAGVHMGIHRLQIERILEGLSRVKE